MSTENSTSNFEIATLGGGCFWCLEAFFQEFAGIDQVMPGYAGGHTEEPSYEQVCGKQTGHAEVVQIKFDPTIVSYHDLLKIFFTLHDPTTLNRQGNDVGSQYRSVVMYHDETQRGIAEEVIHGIDALGIWGRPIVTELVPLNNYYDAEAYHHNYYANNPNQGYCTAVIAPKVAKVRQYYTQLLKENAAAKAS